MLTTPRSADEHARYLLNEIIALEAERTKHDAHGHLAQVVAVDHKIAALRARLEAWCDITLASTLK